MADVDLFIPHQANERMIRSAAKALDIPMEKVLIDLDLYGNTSAATIPIAICDAVERGMLKDGDRIVAIGFGGGLSWAASLVQWGVRQEALSYSQNAYPSKVTG